MSHVLIHRCLKNLVQVACRVQTFTKMRLSILVEIKNKVLILMVSPWTWSTCQNRGVSGLPALISWWLKCFIVTDAECRATWSSRIRTVDSQSFLVTLQKHCVYPWSVWHCSLCLTASLAQREAAALLFSLAAQQKKAGEGSGYMAFLPGLLPVQIISITAG